MYLELAVSTVSIHRHLAPLLGLQVRLHITVEERGRGKQLGAGRQEAKRERCSTKTKYLPQRQAPRDPPPPHLPAVSTQAIPSGGARMWKPGSQVGTAVTRVSARTGAQSTDGPGLWEESRKEPHWTS